MVGQIDDRTILDKFIEDITKIIEKHAKYIVVSGFVAITHGRSRATEDIDMIIERLSFEKFFSLHNDLTIAGFECLQSNDAKLIYFDYLNKNDNVRYIEKGKFLPELDIHFAKDELDEYQIKNRVKLPLTGLNIWFSSIEMNIAFKEELLKTPKDIKDAEHLRLIYKDKLDEKEIAEIKRKIKLLRLKEEHG